MLFYFDQIIAKGKLFFFTQKNSHSKIFMYFCSLNL